MRCQVDKFPCFTDEKVRMRIFTFYLELNSIQTPIRGQIKREACIREPVFSHSGHIHEERDFGAKPKSL